MGKWMKRKRNLIKDYINCNDKKPMMVSSCSIEDNLDARLDALVDYIIFTGKHVGTCEIAMWTIEHSPLYVILVELLDNLEYLEYETIK